MPAPFPPLPGCETCEANGYCTCWTDADQREFEREWNRPRGCTHIGFCECVSEANHAENG